MFSCSGCKSDRIKGVQRIPVDKKFIEKKVAIVGYSVRAINQSAKFCGMSTLTIDCFADMDLRRLADEFIFLNLEQYRDPKGKLKKPLPELLKDEVFKHEKKVNLCDFLLVGSGLENYPEYLEPITKYGNYMGSSTDSIKKVRKLNLILPFLKQNKILFPNTIIFDNNDEAEDVFAIKHIFTNHLHYDFQSEKDKYDLGDLYSEISSTLGVPFVLKSDKTGGGFSIYNINNIDDFKTNVTKVKEVKKTALVAQEKIQGTHMSCSFISNGDSAKNIAFTRQIIGEKRFGCQNDYTYCGNIMNREISDPTHVKNQHLSKKIDSISEKIVKYSSILGSNGLDFIVSNSNSKDAKIYFIEINARFQGTMDVFEAFTGRNIVEMHIESVKNRKLPEKVEFPSEQTFIKSIYYSPLDFYVMVDLHNLEYNDAPLIGNYIQEGQPMCSSIVIGETEQEALNKSLDDRDLITRVLSLESRINEDSSFLCR